ncbi:MAG TPA: amidohydrolase family protein, partial [Bryobacterales bacterium]|nr:amidohydrolase family protein [Bryobacterales bacterium]
VDLHAHVYVHDRPGPLFPDDTALLAGTTTVVDAGSSGWRTFDDFKKRIIDKAQTRVLASLNIVGTGITGTDAENDTSDMDPQKTAEKIRQYPDIIVGIKTAHYLRPGWTAIQRAVEAGRLSGRPVMVDDKIFTNSGRDTRAKLLDYLRPGDMHTHMYNDRQITLIDRFTGKVEPYMWEARRRGVLFDLGHGAGSFLWPVAAAAMAQGFPPDSISTDLHAANVLLIQPDMTNCISKLLSLGMTLQDAIRRSTMNPARQIHRFPELGTLGVGRTADIAVFQLETGVFAYKDAWEMKRMGTKKLECVLTVRGGKVVYDVNGLSFPEWDKAGDYGVIQ